MYKVVFRCEHCGVDLVEFYKKGIKVVLDHDNDKPWKDLKLHTCKDGKIKNTKSNHR